MASRNRLRTHIFDLLVGLFVCLCVYILFTISFNLLRMLNVLKQRIGPLMSWLEDVSGSNIFAVFIIIKLVFSSVRKLGFL